MFRGSIDRGGDRALSLPIERANVGRERESDDNLLKICYYSALVEFGEASICSVASAVGQSIWRGLGFGVNCGLSHPGA